MTDVERRFIGTREYQKRAILISENIEEIRGMERLLNYRGYDFPKSWEI